MRRCGGLGAGVLALGMVACNSTEEANDSPSGGSGDSGASDDRTTGAPDDTGPPPGTTGPDDGPDTTSPTTQPDPVCGNGILEDIEECDDANQIDGDGCDADCTQNLDTVEWQVIHAGDAMVVDSGHGIAVDGAGNIVVGGFEVDTVSDPNLWLAKYDTAGAELWATSFDPSGGLDDRIYAVAIDPQDNILVAGDVDVMPSSSDVYVAKLDPQGNELWSRTFDGPDAGDDGGRGVASDSAGNVVVTGFQRVGTADIDVFVAKLDPAGTTLWSELVPGPDALDDRGHGVAVNAADEVIVAGYVSHGGFDRDVWLRKYDPDGNEVWTETWDNGNNGEDAGFGVTVTPDGSIAVTGMTPIIATNQDVWLGLFDSDGALQWYKRFGGQAYLHDNGLAVAADADGNLVVAGFRGASETDADVWLRKYDAGGNVLWSQAIVGDSGDRDQATAVATDADGNIFVTGEIRSVGNDGDVLVAKLGPG